MFSLFIVAIGSLATVLQFDGSFRPPKDPMPGFTYSSSVFGSDSTKQLAGSEKLASCSAAISLLSINDNEHAERLVAIGGRYLPNVPGITSADTEYEGLLLGLEWLVRAISSEQENSSSISILNDLSNVEYQLARSKLIIRGDCKTVIDQLKSRSVPRKMEAHYNLALDRIESLKDLYADYHQRTTCDNFLGTADVSIPQELSVCFEHVPREENTFCDALCKLIINQKQAEIVKSIQDLIHLGEEDAAKSQYDDCNNHNMDNYIKDKPIKKSKKKLSRLPKSVFFQQALGKIWHTPQLCHSSRIALACKLTEASIRQKDAVILSDISDFFLALSRQWSRIYYRADASDSVGRHTLKKVSIACKNNKTSGGILEDPEICCIGIGIESIFDFCANSESKDYNEDMDSTNSIMLDAYSDISELINSVDVEHRRNVLRNWNEVASESQEANDASIDSHLGLWRQNSSSLEQREVSQ